MQPYSTSCTLIAQPLAARKCTAQQRTCAATQRDSFDRHGGFHRDTRGTATEQQVAYCGRRGARVGCIHERTPSTTAAGPTRRTAPRNWQRCASAPSYSPIFYTALSSRIASMAFSECQPNFGRHPQNSQHKRKFGPVFFVPCNKDTRTMDTVKPGYKSSEFYLSTAAFILGALMASGVIAEGSPVAQAIGLAASALAAMGYSWSRGAAKKPAG